MRMWPCLVALLGMMFVVGCKPTIDTSSEETFKTSVEKVKNSLDKDTQPKFEAALIVVSMKHAMEGGASADSEKKAKAALNGKTANEIIAEAEKIDPNFKANVDKVEKFGK